MKRLIRFCVLVGFATSWLIKSRLNVKIILVDIFFIVLLYFVKCLLSNGMSALIAHKGLQPCAGLWFNKFVMPM